MSQMIIQEMIKICNTKLFHLKNIISISENQKEAITEDNTDLLNSAISEKQAEMDTIDKLDKYFIQKYEELKKTYNINSVEDMDSSTYPDIKELQTKISAIFQALQMIEEIDKYNNEKLNESFEDVKMKLRQIKQGKTINKGYNTNPYGNAFIDEKK